MSSRAILLWVTLIACFGGAVYKLKYEVKAQERRLAAINRQIAAEEDALRVLKAEWSLLNSPDRLAQLAAQALPDLKPVNGRQVMTLDRWLEIRRAGAGAGVGSGVAAARPAPAAARAPEPVSEADDVTAAPDADALAAIGDAAVIELDGRPAMRLLRLPGGAGATR